MYKCLIVAILLLFQIPTVGASPKLNGFKNVYEDLDLSLYCQQKYGSGSKVDFASNHMYGVGCKNFFGNRFSLDMDAVCRKQFGSDSEALLTGVHKYDWKCANWEKMNDVVIPIIIVSADYVFDIDAVDGAISNVAAVLKNVQSWYADHLPESLGRRTFTIARPMIKVSWDSANYWNRLSCNTAEPTELHYPDECLPLFSSKNRNALYYTASEEANEIMKNFKASTGSDGRTVVSVFVFSGKTDAIFHGAAATGPYPSDGTGKPTDPGVYYNVMGPDIAGCTDLNERCGFYGVAHEIGHSFGRPHPKCSSSDTVCRNAVMGSQRDPDKATLTLDDIAWLRQSPFFSEVWPWAYLVN